MLSTYQYPEFAYRRPDDLDTASPKRYPLVVVGAGPVGLSAAIDCAQRGLPVLLIDDDNTVSVGSRGLCYAKRTLEILDRLGCGDAIVDKGVQWNVGRTFLRDQEVFSFNLLPEPGHRRPGMVNLQQYHLEECLVQRAQRCESIELRWKQRVIDVRPQGDGAILSVETVDGVYSVHADWLIVADGARSPIRRMLGLDVDGKVFKDRFLIADVVMKAAFPAERWFWFDPPFHRGQSVLLHREADNVWRIDFQLGWDADPELEKSPERVMPRIQAMLGPEHPFELEWVSVYSFQCRRMQRFRHGRVMFAGDAAHQVSPFGARGANSGIQDADNLGWKLALVLTGKAPDALLDSYSDERVLAADENLSNSTRSTDFITPKSPASKAFRDAVLALASRYAFARALVNSGRLSVPTHLTTSNLNTADVDAFNGTMRPGAPLDDAPVRMNGAADWLLQHVTGEFTLLWFDPTVTHDAIHVRTIIATLQAMTVPVHTVCIVSAGASIDPGALVDVEGLAARRLDAAPGTAYLIRPDQHVVARWRSVTVAHVAAAVARATCNRVHQNPN